MFKDWRSCLTRGLGWTGLLVLAWTAGSSAYYDPATAPAKSLHFTPRPVETTTIAAEADTMAAEGAAEPAAAEDGTEAGSVEGEAVTPEGEEESDEDDEVAPKPWALGFEENAGFGACIGKGAGLAGVFGYLRPSDPIGLEFELGARMVALNLQDYYGSHTKIYWPLAGAAKLQIFFQDRGARYQSGLALGVLMAQDAGIGGSAAYISHIHLAGHLCLDWEIGVGTFPSIQDNLTSYLEQTVGRGYTFDVQSLPVFLMWGVGLSGAF